MRALVYADLQATDGHERCFGNPTKALQLYRVERFFDEIERIYKELECDALWDLGDTTDDRTAVPVPVIDLLCDRLERFEGKWNLKLVGNHEQFLRDTAVHAGKMFRRFFRVVETCEAIQCGNVNILCVSFHDEVDAITRFLRLHRMKRPSILLGHFQIAGCQMPSGMSVLGIPRSELDFVNIGLLGHIHKPQALGNLHYVGSPFQQNWGESGEGKRVAIVDIQGANINVEWVPLQGFPHYRQVSFQEFTRSAKAGAEDRFKVVLKSVEETEAYYAHPLANRADEAIYDYEQTVKSEADEAAEVIPRSKQDILRRYLHQNPPKDWQIVLDDESMLAYGEQISTGT